MNTTQIQPQENIFKRILWLYGLYTLLCGVLNLMTVRGFSLGYFLPISLGIVSGLVLGTNSFIADDLSRYSVREGMALGLFFGGVEMLGYILVIAATVNFEIYRYESWWRWNQKTIWVKRLNEVRLSRPEMLCLVTGIMLVLMGAYRETAMSL